MKNKRSFQTIVVFLILILLLVGGCTEIINPINNNIEYEKQPTKISYNISYFEYDLIV